MDIETAFAHIEAYIAGGDELGEVTEDDASKALDVLRAENERLRTALHHIGYMKPVSSVDFDWHMEWRHLRERARQALERHLVNEP